MADPLENTTKFLLSVRCMSLHVKKDVNFHKGVMSSLMDLARGPQVAKNERRRIKISQSAAYELSGRPPSLLYDCIHESEIFDDNPDLTPAVMVEILCPEGYDSKIRVNVYYSSSLTGYKDIVLAGTTFGLRELLRSYKLFSSVMNSDYCVGAKTIAEISPLFPPVLTSSALYPMEPPVMGAHRNPLIQHFSFYSEEDITSPLVDCQELCWEPRFVYKLPILLLDNISERLLRSIMAWKARGEMERMRQGQFTNEEEAFRNGWHVLKCTVLGTRFATSRGSDSNSRTQPVSASASMPTKLERRGSALTMRLATQIPASEHICSSSYVEVSLDDKTRQFAVPIGKTNVEYFNNEPLYGSNLHAGAKKTQDFVPASKAVHLESVPKAFHFKCTDFDGNVENVSVAGSVNSFVTYISDVDNSCVRLNLYVELQDANPSHTSHGMRRDSSASAAETHGGVFCGYAFVPLTSGEENVVDVPVMMMEQFSTYFEAEITVRVSVRSSKQAAVSSALTAERRVTGNTAKVPAPARIASSHFPTVTLLNPSHAFKDTVIGEPEFRAPGSNKLAESQAQFAVAPRSEETASVFSLARPMSKLHFGDDDTDQNGAVITGCNEWLWLIGYSGNDPLVGPARLPVSHLGATAAVSGKTLVSTDDSVRDDRVRNRVDYVYPLDWIDEHVKQLEQLYRDTKTMVSECNKKMLAGERFRPSTLKKNMDYQIMPINLHLQLLLSRRHIRADESIYSKVISDINDNSAPSAVQQDIHITDSVTCGSPSPHGLGHKNGGLEVQENKLAKERQAIELLKEQFFAVTGDAKSLSPSGAAAELLNKIGQRTMALETQLLVVAKRRICSISQALSTVVNGVMMKLSLLVEGYIPAEVAQDWVSHGMLVLFEGLLSVTGHERSMIEDTMVTAEVLRQFSVRVVECEDVPGEAPITHPLTGQPRRPSAPPIASSCTANTCGLSTAPSSTIASSGTTFSPTGYNAYMKSSYNGGVYVTISGREVSLHIPTSTFKRLPECLRVPARVHTDFASHGSAPGSTVPLKPSVVPGTKTPPVSDPAPGVVIRIVSGLINQGIDIQQSMATAMKSDKKAQDGDEDAESSDGSSDLQRFINMRTLKLLNNYCHLTRPEESTTASVAASAAAAAGVGHARTRGSAPELGAAAVAAAQQSVSHRSSLPSDGSTSPALPYGVPHTSIHSICRKLDEYIRYTSATTKNVELIQEAERVCLSLNGLRVTFCKSGKDRTGMGVTLEQSRILGEKFQCGNSQARIIRDAQTMREYGCRVMIADKNIGRRVYSINSLQAQFIPLLYRPPVRVQEGLLKGENLS